MRVLWFLDSEPPAVRRRLGAPGLNEASWHGGLADILAATKSIELAVACRAAEPFEPFEAAGVRYFEVGASHPRRGIERVSARWRELRAPSVDLHRCRALVEHERPDVIHVHGTESALGLLSASTPAPLVVSIQGLLTVCRIMDLRGLDPHLLRALSPGLFVRGSGFLFERLQLRSWSARERRILATVSHVIGRTRFDADVVRVINSRAQYYHCDEALRPPFWESSWRTERAQPGRVLAVVRGYARKGVGTLLDAMALLRDMHLRETDGVAARAAAPHLRIAGDPINAENERAIRHGISTLNLEGSVMLLGSLSASQLADELGRAAAFALPSHIDNSPNSLAEAMLVGTPTVASAVGGVPSLARDDIEALLVQDGDPFALAGALHRLLGDPDLAGRLSQAASTTAHTRHDPEAIRSRMLQIYEQVAATRVKVPA
jgi:glycosyltransferase involved in cell wall biosynthesis